MYFVVSCTNCRQGHRKCDRLLPTCTLCQQRNITCVYHPPKKRRRKMDSQHSESDEEEELESSIVQYSTEQIDMNKSSPPITSSSSSTNIADIPKQLPISPIEQIDTTVIRLYVQRMERTDRRSSILSKLVHKSLSFLDQFESFQHLFSSTSSLPAHLQPLMRQYKINFAFLQSIQAVTYIKMNAIGDSSISEEEVILQKVTNCFEKALDTIMSDSAILLESSSNALVAWVWASLGVSTVIDHSKLSKINVFLKQVELFLETNTPKPQPKSFLFSSSSTISNNTTATNNENEQFVPLLNNIKNSLTLLSRVSNDEEFIHYSILDVLHDMKKLVQFDSGGIRGMDIVFIIICNIIEKIEQIKLTFSILGSNVSMKELELQIVQVLAAFDNFVEAFSNAIGTIENVQEFRYLPLFLAMYETKLKFVEELQMGFDSFDSNPSIIVLLENLVKARYAIANQFYQLFRKHETNLIRKGQVNVRRCMIKMIEIHMQNINTALEVLQNDFRLLTIIQHSYMASDTVNQIIEKLREIIFEKEKQSADTELLLDENAKLFANSTSFLDLEEILQGFI